MSCACIIFVVWIFCFSFRFRYLSFSFFPPLLYNIMQYSISKYIYIYKYIFTYQLILSVVFFPFFTEHETCMYAFTNTLCTIIQAYAFVTKKDMKLNTTIQNISSIPNDFVAWFSDRLASFEMYGTAGVLRYNWLVLSACNESIW